MPELPARPNLEQYKKQAKDLLHDHGLGTSAALVRIAHNHPRLHKLPESDIRSARFILTDAQLVLAREHGFESWPKLTAHIRSINLINSVADPADPVAAFIEAACVPRHSGHATGDLAHAEIILSRYPQVATANIYTAAILADEATVRSNPLARSKNRYGKRRPARLGRPHTPLLLALPPPRSLAV